MLSNVPRPTPISGEGANNFGSCMAIAGVEVKVVVEVGVEVGSRVKFLCISRLWRDNGVESVSGEVNSIKHGL